VMGQVVSTIISAVTMIFIARVLGAESYGEYTITMIPVSIAMLLQDLGVSTSITRFCANYRQQDDNTRLKEIVWTGILFTLSISTVVSLTLFFASDLISSVFLLNPRLGYLLKVASFAVLGNGFYSSAQAVFTGYEKMHLRSIIQIIWSISRGIFAVALVWLGYGKFGVIISYSLSYLLAGLLGILFVYLFIKFRNGSELVGFRGIFQLLLGFGLPIYAGSLLSSGLSQWYNSLMILNVPTDLIGNYGAATNFGVLVSFLTMPIGTVLFPLFSRVDRNDPQLKLLFDSAVKYTTLLATPIVALLILMSSSLIQVIYGLNYPYAALYLSGYLLLFVFEGLGGTSLSYLILGIGETRVSFISMIVTFIVGVPLSFVLISRYQILGLIAASIIAPRFGWLFIIFWMKKNIGFTIDWSGSLKIYGLTIGVFIVSYFVLNFLNLDGWLKLVIGSVLFFALFFLGLPFTRILNKGALRELDKVVSVSGPVTPILRYLISVIRLLTK